MNALGKEEWESVAGGAPTGMVCAPTVTVHATSGNIDVTSASQLCQLAGGGTQTTRIETTVTHAGAGLTGVLGKITGLEIGGDHVNTKIETVTCNAKQECTTETSNSRSDLDDGSGFESFAGGDFDFGGGGDGGGCVQIASHLPCGKAAGDILVGTEMQLSDQVSLKAGVGVVSYSKRKKAPGYRLTTVSGVSLVCSNTAPIPTTDGIVLAPNVLGKSVAVRRDEGGTSHSAWEMVASVDAIGEIEVQHITVGDKCFWAGEKPNSYILHHNIKNANDSYGAENFGNDISWDDWA